MRSLREDVLHKLGVQLLQQQYELGLFGDAFDVSTQGREPCLEVLHGNLPEARVVRMVSGLRGCAALWRASSVDASRRRARTAGGLHLASPWLFRVEACRNSAGATAT